MTTVVLNANTLASGAIAPPGGTLATIVDSWLAGAFDVALSTHILGELERTLAKPYFTTRLDRRTIAAYLALVRAGAMLTMPLAQVPCVATHPEDDLVLATAVSAGAAYLITGDWQLQALGTYAGVTILSPRAFLDVLATLLPTLPF